MCWNSLTTWHSREGKTDPSGLMGGLNLGQGEAGNWEPPEKVCSCWNTSYLAYCQGYSGRELLQSWTVHMTGFLVFFCHTWKDIDFGWKSSRKYFLPLFWKFGLSFSLRMLFKTVNAAIFGKYQDLIEFEASIGMSSVHFTEICFW